MKNYKNKKITILEQINALTKHANRNNLKIYEFHTFFGIVGAKIGEDDYREPIYISMPSIYIGIRDRCEFVNRLK